MVAIDGEPIFKAPETGDFRLPPASPARNRGKIIELRGRVSWTSDADDGKPDIGAYEGNRPMRGPPYRHFDVPDLYRERPRIIDVAWYRDEDKSKNKSELRISFSIEVEDVNTLNDPRVIIRHENNTPYEADVCRTNNATLICTFLADLPLPLDRSVQIQLPFGIRSVPQDGQSEPMTLWASTYPNISIRHPGR
ncbi:MAG: hypothetical protein GTO41_24660 [Burkholderiales bacterium]|nr:hypothetical protein [Burkholderiales bacterium]